MRDGVIWVGLAACVGALFVSTPLEAACACAVVALLLHRARRRVLLVFVAFALLVGAWRAHRAVTRFEAARTAVLDAGGWPARCVVTGTVVRAPALVGGAYRVDIDARAVECPETRERAGPLESELTSRPELGWRGVTAHPALRGRVTLHSAAEPPPARGDLVTATASVAPPYRFWNDGTGDPRPAAARRATLLSGGAEDLVVLEHGHGVGSLIDRARARLRERIVATFPEDTAPMARALVLGEDDLSADDSRAFRSSGLAHLLAVSGMHLVLVVMGFVAALRAGLVRWPALAERFDVGRLAAAIGIPGAWLYADLAGGSGSAVRAAWMCSVVLLARALGRHSSSARALGLSLLAMSALDPLVIFDVSFVLSALATAGLLGLARPIQQWFEARERRLRLPTALAQPLATTLAATIACAPVLATIAPSLPLGGLVANLVAVPLGEAAALPLCLVHGLLELWPDAEHGCAIAASGALVLVRLVARAFTWGALPVPVPTAAQLAVLGVLGAGLGFVRRRRLFVGASLGALVALEIITRIRGAPHGMLRATFLDVGQGDAALVDLPDGSAILIDGGGLVGSPLDVGDRVVAPMLAARRRSRLRAVILSHPHPDHFLGLTAALTNVSTAEFWDTGQGEAEIANGLYPALLHDLRRRGTRVLHPSELCGTHEIGGAFVDILAPCPGPDFDRGPNDNSFVIRFRYGTRAILFVGDAEHLEERTLMDRGLGVESLKADVLKVGHHGSRTSSTLDFLAAVKPTEAIISCGVRNRFGHPHASTLEHLAQARIHVFRTDRDGSVVVATDGQVLSTTPMYGRLR